MSNIKPWTTKSKALAASRVVNTNPDVVEVVIGFGKYYYAVGSDVLFEDGRRRTRIHGQRGTTAYYDEIKQSLPSPYSRRKQ